MAGNLDSIDESKEAHRYDVPKFKETPVRVTSWAIFFALLMLLFATLTIVALVIPRPRSLEEADAARRKALVGDGKVKQLIRLNSYGWVDEKTHTAHIPIDIAMKDYAAKQNPAMPKPDVKETENKEPIQK
jgi:hypothetical protein